jgi:hypothetical protein
VSSVPSLFRWTHPAAAFPKEMEMERKSDVQTL